MGRRFTGLAVTLILILAAGAGCGESQVSSSPSSVVYGRLDEMFDSSSTIAGAEMIGLTTLEDGRINVTLLDASEEQLKQARQDWPGVLFESGGDWDLTATLPPE